MTDMNTTERFASVDGYSLRLHEYKDALNKRKGDKYTLVNDALNGFVNLKIIKDYCGRMKRIVKDVDFDFVILIRLLYILHPVADSVTNAREAVNLIFDAFIDFPFWPRKYAEEKADMSKQVFWSENHLFMFLGTAHLFNQWLKDNENTVISKKSRITDLEEALLRVDLDAHIEFGGFYECNSHVYFPYTLSGLLNLYDYSHDPDVKSKAGKLANILTKQLLAGTSDHHIATFAVSARSFPRTRQHVNGHNVNHFIRLLTGSSPDQFDTTSIANFLIATGWRPDPDTFKAWLNFNHVTFTSSHSKTEIRQLYKKHFDIMKSRGLAVEAGYEELIPFYWSAGLITDPDFVYDTREFMSTRNLSSNIQLLPLALLIQPVIRPVMRQYAQLSCGQSYCDVKMSVYKQPGGLVVSSLPMFNPSRVGYQQLPWIVNVDGVAMWSQSGAGDESISGFGLTNTHNPYVKQHENVIVAAYSAPPATQSVVLGNILLNPKVRLFWPGPFLHEAVPAQNTIAEGAQFEARMWWYGRRHDVFIGVYCSQATHTITSHSNDGDVSCSDDSKRYQVLPRRVCTDTNHFWIVVTGTKEKFTNLEAFKSYCQAFKCTESERQSGYLYGYTLKDKDYTVKVDIPGGEVIDIKCEHPED